MKVEGGMASNTILHKVKVKEEAKECCGSRQPSSTVIATTTAVTTATMPTTIMTATATATTATTSSTSMTSSGTASIATTTGSSNSVASIVSNSNGVSSVDASSQPSANSDAPHQPSAIVCYPSAPASSVHVSTESFPVDLDLKTKASSAVREKASREDASSEVHSPSTDHQTIPASGGSPSTGQSKQSENGSRAECKGTSGCSGFAENDSFPLKPESEDSAIGSAAGSGSSGNETSSTAAVSVATTCRTEEQSNDASASSSTASNGTRCIAGVFACHGELKSVLGTVVKFATGISPDTGDTVLTFVLALLSGTMTAEEFHSALQEATNYSLKGFVLPHLKQQLPTLQRDLSNAARASNQSCAQFLRSNEAAVLEAVGLVAAAEPVDIFGEQPGNGIGSGNGGNQCSAHYGIRSNSNPGVGSIQHANNTTGGLHHYSSGASHAPKRRASDTPYYENGAALLEDVPVYGKRLTNPWSHHHPSQQQQSPENSSPYCWYHPLHSSSGSIQGHGYRHAHSHGHGHGHGPSPIPPASVQMNQINAFSGSHHLAQQQQQQQQQPQQQMSHVQTQNGSLDDEWKNIHMMLNCILGMVEKTKKALAILQTRGCFGAAAAAAAVAAAATAPSTNTGVPAQNGNGTVAPSSNPSSSNGSQVESSTGDREGSLKRLSGEIVAQTIRAIEDKVAEVKRKDEEAVKRVVMAEVQRAVRVAVAESRANERLRVHRLIDVPLSSRSHLRQGPYLRFHGNPGPVDANARTVATPTTPGNSIPSTSEEEKDPHLQAVSGSSCWNCGRPALETCGGCGIARYCGSFCQHRDWEAGGHHATCNNPPPPREPPRSASRSPPRIPPGPLSSNVNDAANAVTAPISASVASKGK